MGNLGRYQDVVTEAKAAGGVDTWIEILQDTAAADAAERGFAKGAGAGAAAVGLATAGALLIRELWLRHQERREVRVEAQTQIRAEVERAMATSPKADGGSRSAPRDERKEPTTSGVSEEDV